MKIKSYKDKETGKTLYKFNAYLGLDPLTGKEIRTNRQGFISKKQAEIEYIKLKNKRTVGNHTYTLDEMVKMWAEQYEKTVKYTTYTKIMGTFRKHILPYIGSKKLEKITPTIVQSLIDLKAKEIVEFKNINIYLRKVYKFAIGRGITDYNPCTNIVYPKKERENPNLYEYREKEELQKFLDACKKELPTMWYVFFRIASYAGLRKGEILALQWNDIDFKDQTISVTKSLSFTKASKKAITKPKTKTSVRVISLDEDTIKILREWKKLQKDLLKFTEINQYVFTTENNELLGLNYPRKKFIRVIKKYKLRKIRLHSLRHTHASLCFEAGMSIKDVQYRLGHSSPDTTMKVYVHVTKSKEKKSAEKFAKLMSS